jgi:hypothetical protein
MAGPQILGGGGDKGPAAIQAGIASIQQLGQFLEQRRQFDEEQTRLKRQATATWGLQFLQELKKGTRANSYKDLCVSLPGPVSYILQMALDIDEPTAMSYLTAIGNSPYNAEERFFNALTIRANFGGTKEEDTAAYVKKDTDDINTKAAASKETPAGERVEPVVEPVKVEPVKVAPTIVPKGMEPGQLDPTGVLNQLKTELYHAVKQQEKEGFAVGLGGILPTKRVVDKYKTENPTYIKAIAKWESENMSSFLLDVEKGRWEPGMIGSQPRPSAAVPSEAMGKIPTPKERRAEAARELKMKTVTGTAKAPSPKLNISMTDYINAFMDDEGPGQVAVKGRKFKSELTSAMNDSMIKTVAGQKILVDDAAWILNDPGIMRGMAILQNAPSVYATDMAGEGKNPASKYALAKAFVDFQRSLVGFQRDQLSLAREGLQGQKDEVELTMAGITLAGVQSGMLATPALAPQLDLLMVKENEAIQKMDAAKAKNDQATAESYRAEANRWRRQRALVMEKIAEAAAGSETDAAKEWGRVAKTVLRYEPATVLGLQFTRFLRRYQAGSIVEGAVEGDVATAKPTITQGGQDFEQAKGL